MTAEAEGEKGDWCDRQIEVHQCAQPGNTDIPSRREKRGREEQFLQISLVVRG